MTLQSIEDISFIKTVQKVNRQTFMERARMNYGCGDESKRGEDVRVSQSPKRIRQNANRQLSKIISSPL